MSIWLLESAETGGELLKSSFLIKQDRQGEKNFVLQKSLKVQFLFTKCQQQQKNAIENNQEKSVSA